MEKTETRRLSKQCSKILALLREGPVTNYQLANVSLKYTSRISDLRALGYDVQCYMRDRRSGLSAYRLRREPDLREVA